MNAQPVRWTPKLEARLIELRTLGYSQRQIADVLGIGFYSVKRKLELFRADGHSFPPPLRTPAHLLGLPPLENDDERRLRQSEEFIELLRDCGGSHTSLTIKTKSKGPWA